MVLFIILGIAISLFLRRNPFKIIQYVKFRYSFLFIISIVIQGLMEVLVNQLPRGWVITLFNIAILIMLVALFLNRHVAGMKLIFLGTAMNLLAVILHNGLMPVSESAMRMAGLQEQLNFYGDSRHQLMEDTIFWWLGDWIPMFGLGSGNYVMSVGDLIVGIGLTVFIISNSIRGRFQ